MGESELYGTEFGKTSTEYLIGERIGAGGYGEVYRATEIEIERTVALKVLRRSETGRYPEKLRQRFLREAKIIGKLQDPNTVRLLEYGTDDKTKLLFMAFEFIDGNTISEFIQRDGPLEPGRVVEILKRALSALEEAHAEGILHRDIKPGNIMIYEYLGRTDQVKVLDFGIGKLIREATSGITAAGSLVGTPKYMSPEQMRGEGEIGPASDIFALGLVAYEMLVGHSLLPSEPLAVTGRLLSPEQFTLPESVCLHAQGVRAVVEKMLEKELQHRYTDARSVIRDLNYLRPLDPREVEHLGEASFKRSPVGSEGTTVKQGLRPARVEVPEIQSEPKQKNKAVPLGLAGLLLISAAVASFAWSATETKPAPAQIAHEEEPIQVLAPTPGPTQDNRPILVATFAARDAVGEAKAGALELVREVTENTKPEVITARPPVIRRASEKPEQPRQVEAPEAQPEKMNETSQDAEPKKPIFWGME